MEISSSQTPAESPDPSSLSPDKKWEYSGGDSAKLNKVGSREVAVNFSDACDLGALSENSAVHWAPDSKRFAFYACGAGKEHLTLLYQLGDDNSWKALAELPVTVTSYLNGPVT